MANSLISMVKGDSTLINNTEVLNGQILFDETKQKIFLDDNAKRKEYGGSDDNAVKKNDVAYVESAMVATRGYSAGNYIIVQDTLYKATTQINSGTALVVGTNVSTTTVGNELTRINNDLTAISQNTPDVVIDNTGRKNGQMLYLLLQQVNFSKINANTKLEVGTNVFTLCTLDTTNQHLRFSRTDLTNTGSVRIINANIQNNANVYVASEGGTFSDLSEESAAAPFLIYY